jgi:hypothetical protein
MPDPQVLELEVLSERLAICRLEPEEAEFDWDLGGGFLSVTFTEDEISVVCEEAFAPPDAQIERGWRCLKVLGPLDLEMVGVLASLSAALAAPGIPIFVVSTFETDYVLVRAAILDTAIEALRAAGHTVRTGSEF